MPSENWYCKSDGETNGPYSFEELAYLAYRNRLEPNDKVRCGETGNWIVAGSVSNLFPSKVSSSNLKKEKTPNDNADVSEPIVAKLVEPIKKEPDVPEIREPFPPLDPNRRLRIGLTIAAISIVLLFVFILILLLMFWKGDGGKGTAKGDGGTSSGSATSPSANSDEGNSNENATGNSSGGTDSQQSKGTNVDENPIAEEKPVSLPKSGSDEPADSSNGLKEQDLPPPKKQSDQKPSQSEKKKASKKRKPITTTQPTLAYDIENENKEPEKPTKLKAKDSGSSKGGPGKEGTFFGVRAKGRKFVYIVDCSGSMSGGPFSRVCDELVSSIKDLTKKQSFYVLFFNESSIPMFGLQDSKMMLAKDKNIAKLENWVLDFRVDGGTDPTEALQNALAMDPDAIFFLTDGEIPQEIPLMLMKLNKQMKPPSSKSAKTKSTLMTVVPINTIGFENSSGELILKLIAKENDGEYRFIPEATPSAGQPPSTPFYRKSP
jgi:Mg-chelatase subunit ChlD